MPFSIEPLERYLASYRRRVISSETLIPAGVLLLLTEYEKEFSLIFTLRTERVEHHKGQISFPGGVRERTDAGIIDTALRETEEEIGLPRKAVRTLGVLDDYATPTGFCMTPVVGYTDAVPHFQLHAAEVAEVFFAPLSFFQDASHEEVEQREILGALRTMYAYQYRHYRIWGATAAILHNFIDAVGRAANSNPCAKTL